MIRAIVNIILRKQKLFFSCVSCTSVLFSLMLAVSSFAYEKEVNALSAAIAEKIAKADRTSVAVVDFTDLEGNVTQLGRFIAEEFSTALAGAGKGFKVIDRTHLNSIIKENKLSATGLIDPATARKLGKIVNVQALITGTLTPFGENVRVAVKVLDTATAEIIDAVRGNIAKTQGIEELLGKGIAVVHVRSTTSTTKKEAKITVAKQSQNGATSGPFSDDFNMGPKPGWKSIIGNWTMSNGKYTVTSIRGEESYLALLEGKKWRNFIMELDVTPGHVSAAGFSRTNHAIICPRIISVQEKVCFGVFGTGHSFNKAYWFIVSDKENGEMTSKVPIKIPSGRSVHIKIEVKNGVFTSYINGAQVNQIYDTTFPTGTIGLSHWYGDWSGPRVRVTFDNIKITPLSEQ